MNLLQRDCSSMLWPSSIKKAVTAEADVPTVCIVRHMLVTDTILQALMR